MPIWLFSQWPPVPPMKSCVPSNRYFHSSCPRPLTTASSKAEPLMVPSSWNAIYHGPPEVRCQAPRMSSAEVSGPGCDDAPPAVRHPANRNIPGVARMRRLFHFSVCCGLLNLHDCVESVGLVQLIRHDVRSTQVLRSAYD